MEGGQRMRLGNWNWNGNWVLYCTPPKPSQAKPSGVGKIGKIKEGESEGHLRVK